MQTIGLILYNLIIRIYGLSVYAASFYNPKAKLWINGRKSQLVLPDSFAIGRGKKIWFHCASLGEFEQARPVIEKIKKLYPDTKIILSFFSPSGYEIRKNYSYADLVVYLPLDTKANAIKFLNVIRPDMALFVKYEFWYHYLSQLEQRKIPVILFSATFRKEQAFFKWYGQFFRRMLGMFDKIFVQNHASLNLLKSIGIAAEIAFDTRFDRVLQVAENRKYFLVVEKFKAGSKLLIGGSTWEKDEQLLVKLINEKVLKGYKYIIAPHQPLKKEMEQLRKNLSVASAYFSELNETTVAETGVIIIDTIGDLASLYAYGDIAYVGGGFNAAVHNVLEPAVFGMPVLFGPNYFKSVEAAELINCGAAYTVNSYTQLTEKLNYLQQKPENLVQAGKNASGYVKQHPGGTETVIEYIKPLL